jgi:hypothetical protein
LLISPSLQIRRGEGIGFRRGKKNSIQIGCNWKRRGAISNTAIF